MSGSTVEDDEVSRVSDLEKDQSTSTDFESKASSSVANLGNTPEKRDSACLKRSKMIVVALVVITAVIAGCATYFYTSRNQDEEFESRVRAK